ncbi:methylamine utilization protein [Sphingomonas gilva]|uniref:Methylamine utilization protein n=1 Tax=Sphingomonas gilva TaxID=2305907 RepID=A0A396RL74_9SPHN|nr:methylamine utilization protein [Sphingomonas gilva]RHW16879.1 methylamine utilization protein [Sphingomonas gilva]
MIAALLLVAAGFGCASWAAADATFAITIRDANGVPVHDAVVTIVPAGGVGDRPVRFAWANRMVQKDIAFNPGTLIVPVGAEVGFPNADKVRHHVYSFSKAAKFNLKLFGRDETRSHRFSVAGNVALGCNIHDRMKGYIKVVDTPFAARTDEYGQLRIAGLPGGRATVKVWHPLQRAKDGESSYQIDIPAGGVANKDLSLAMRPR